MNDLIVVKQLPVIEEQLKLIKGQIEDKVSTALSMVCTDETVKTIKEMRAELNRDFNALEDKRKEVKNKVLSPYEQFEAIYKECVTQVFRPADQQLKEKIDEVENGLKEQKKAELLEYFTECLTATGIDFVDFEQTGVTVTLTASKKSLKEKVKTFVDKVADEMALIETQDFKAEILVEYKKSLNVASAITMVSNRHKAIEAEKEREETRRRIEESKLAAAQKVDEVMDTPEPPPLFAPVAVENVVEAAAVSETIQPNMNETVYRVDFSITATLDKLKALKKFLIDGGYSYESK